MQAACSLREFVVDLQAMPKSNPFVGTGKLYKSSSEVLSKMSSATSGAVSPAQLRELIAESAPMFAGRQQQDAHEFLLEYVNQLHDELLGARMNFLESKLQIQSEGTEDLEEIEDSKDVAPLATQLHLDSEITKRLECVECRGARDVVERFRDFSLDFPGGAIDVDAVSSTSSSLRDRCELHTMLKSYFETEVLEAKCEHCGASKARMEKQLTQAPRVLVLHLKRFVPNFEKQRYDKNKQNVQIPLEFDLNSYLGTAYASCLDGAAGASKLSTLPARPLAAEANLTRRTWEFYTGERWEPMLQKQARFLDEQLNTGKASCDMEVNGRTYTIDFEKKEQVNNSSKTRRPIRWNDEPGHDTSGGPIYELRSIVAHDGASPHSGHYVCYARLENKNWRLYDDSFVREIPADRHPEWELGRRAYVLFYVLQNPH
jgi:uncharacterized UBP type Zn finger protein